MTTALTLLPAAAGADRLETRKTNNFGVAGGLIDMLTADRAQDGQLSVTVSHFDSYTRNTASFQFLPWLSGSFRYIGADDLSPVFDVYYDRSFDLKFPVIEEADYLPALAVGLRDLLWTGALSSEYVVATKRLSKR